MPRILVKYVKREILFVGGEKRLAILQYSKEKFHLLRNFETFLEGKFLLTILSSSCVRYTKGVQQFGVRRQDADRNLQKEPNLHT
jgi:hypothetical protein